MFVDLKAEGPGVTVNLVDEVLDLDVRGVVASPPHSTLKFLYIGYLIFLATMVYVSYNSWSGKDYGSPCKS